MTFPEWGSSENCLSSRNSCPMNSMGMPGVVISRPVATRLRLLAEQVADSVDAGQDPESHQTLARSLGQLADVLR